MSRTTSGTMLAQKFGGGTADMEFEALTGMSMGQFAPQVSIAYQMVVPNYDSFPSAVQLFEDRGHGALAIHPFTTGLYRRESVYPIFGFDDFISQRGAPAREADRRQPADLGRLGLRRGALPDRSSRTSRC